MFLSELLSKIVHIQASEDEKGEKYSLVKHHLMDIREALEKAERALEEGNGREVLDNVVIIQSSALDAEELITERKPKL